MERRDGGRVTGEKRWGWRRSDWGGWRWREVIGQEDDRLALDPEETKAVFLSPNPSPPSH